MWFIAGANVQASHRPGPLKWWVLAFAIGAVAAARAEAPVVLPCRPTIACTAQIEKPGLLVIEAGYLLRRLTPDVTQHSVPFLIKLSFNDWLQGQFGSNGPTFANGASPARFQDDLTAGMKVRLFQRESTAVSLSATLSVPLPAQLGYLRTWDALFVGYLSQDLPLGFSADLNAGLNLWRIESSPLLQAWAALAINHDLPAGLTAMVEVYRFGAAQPVSPRDGGLLVALSYTAAPWLVLDGGTDLGLVSDRALSVFIGFTVSPVHLF
jgi:hypothetical protein